MSINTALFIIGGVNNCFIFSHNSEILRVSKPIHELEHGLEQYGFQRINMYTIVNTKYIIKTTSKRCLILKNGSIHKVSRSKWKHMIGASQ